MIPGWFVPIVYNHEYIHKNHSGLTLTASQIMRKSPMVSNISCSMYIAATSSRCFEARRQASDISPSLVQFVTLWMLLLAGSNEGMNAYAAR